MTKIDIPAEYIDVQELRTMSAFPTAHKICRVTNLAHIFLLVISAETAICIICVRTVRFEIDGYGYL